MKTTGLLFVHRVVRIWYIFGLKCYLKEWIENMWKEKPLNQPINYLEVSSVYSGKPGCCCGCRGKHYYYSSNGSNKMIRSVVNKVNKSPKSVAAYWDNQLSHYFLELPNRWYVVYPKNWILTKQFIWCILEVQKGDRTWRRKARTPARRVAKMVRPFAGTIPNGTYAGRVLCLSRMRALTWQMPHGVHIALLKKTKFIGLDKTAFWLYIIDVRERTINRREPAMNENLNVIVTEDGRWDDEAWLTEQASISAMQDAFENGVEVGWCAKSKCGWSGWQTLVSGQDFCEPFWTEGAWQNFEVILY